MAPKLSILVPVYNVEKYLKECIESIAFQSLKDIEIICINDGSTDNSLKILESYASFDTRIKIINKENSGYGHSMNMGLETAQGEYVGIIESDDFADKKMFEELYNLAIKNSSDLVKSDFYYYKTEGKKSRKAGKIKNYKPFSIQKRSYILKGMPTIWSAIYKNSFLKENNIKFLETKGASYQDTSFAFKALSLAKNIVFTNKAYVHYRTDNENSSVNSREKVFAISDEFDEITKFLNEHNEIKDDLNSIKLSTQFNRYKWNLIRIKEEFRDEFIEKFQNDFLNFKNNNEIKLPFYFRVRPYELNLLLSDKKGFRKFIDNEAKKHQDKLNRRKMFSVRINSSRISIVLFGKQIVEIG